MPRALFREFHEEPLPALLRSALQTATDNAAADLRVMREAVTLADKQLAGSEIGQAEAVGGVHGDLRVFGDQSVASRLFARISGAPAPETAKHTPRQADPLYAVWARKLG